MTIRIYDNRIDFGNYSLVVSAKGVSVNATNSNVTGTFISSFEFTNSPFQGTIAGYTSGGLAPGFSNVIDKFRFSIVNNSTDVGDLTQARGNVAGQSSSIYGYTSGGNVPPFSNVIDKFPFASNSNATDVGDLTQAKHRSTGQSSATSGYTSGGFAPPGVNTIEKFSFSIDANSTDVGDLTQARNAAAGQSSSTHGYTSGGVPGAPSASQLNTIDKFPFSVDTNATDVGDLTGNFALVAGVSSTTHGYVLGGGWGSTPVATIQRFSFITNQSATAVASLNFGRYGSCGHSSETNGFISGGFTSPPETAQNTIERFPFDAASLISKFSWDVGDLTVARGNAAGTQD